jgi:hypothetical protein
MSGIKYDIYEYIEYSDEYYNGRGGYSYSIHCGCIVSINKDSYNVIKQYGGQIWHGVTPYCKIEEDKFLSKFIIYDEYKNSLIKIKDDLPERIRNVIEDKCAKDINTVKRSVLNYTLKKYLNKKKYYKGLKISPETWAIEWYIYNVLRNHEPYKIKSTLTYCYGATKELQKFMEENIDFMISMQFISDIYSNIVVYLIEEKILEFKQKEGKFTDKEYFSKIFPRLFILREIKLKTYLKFRTIILDIYVNLEIYYNKIKYKLVIPSDNLIDTKIIFPSRYGKPKETNSKCPKKKEFDDILQYKNEFSNKSEIPYTYDTKKKELIHTHNNKKIKINYDPDNSTVYFSNCSKLLVFENCYSHGMYSKLVFTLFNLDGKMLGLFELHYNDFDSVFAKVK